MLYAIDLKRKTYLWDDVGCETVEEFIQYTKDNSCFSNDDYQFIMDDQDAVKYPVARKKYVILSFEDTKFGAQTIDIATVHQVKESVPEKYIEVIFDIEDLITKGTLL